MNMENHVTDTIDEHGLTAQIVALIPPDVMREAIYFSQGYALRAVKGMAPSVSKVVTFTRAFKEANRRYLERWLKEHANVKA